MAAGIGFLPGKFGMDSTKRLVKGFRHFHESHRESGAPPNQDIIVSGTHRAPGGRNPHGFAQTAANPVALDGAPCLPRHRETDAHRAMISPIAPLEDKRPVCGSHATDRGPKIAPAP
jgi:hypothetical protein